MYKNAKKVIISMCIWTAVTIVFVIPAVVFWGISFDNSVYDDLPDPLMYRIVYLFLAIVCTAPFIMFWIKFVQFMLINRINDLPALPPASIISGVKTDSNANDAIAPSNEDKIKVENTCRIIKAIIHGAHFKTNLNTGVSKYGSSMLETWLK